jgi:hypothetical protein
MNEVSIFEGAGTLALFLRFSGFPEKYGFIQQTGRTHERKIQKTFRFSGKLEYLFA